MTTATAEHVRLTLRDYQQTALDKIAAAEARGVRRQLGVAATGLGKTVIFCALAEQRGGRTLVLAHRDELVNQAAAKVREVWPGVDVGIVKAEQNGVLAQVVVASVQTLARSSRLEKLCQPFESGGVLTSCDPFDLVVIDEAHHARADSYVRICDRLRTGAEDGPLLLGVTATPDRGDGQGLDHLFDEVVFSNDILWGIAHGYLSDLRGARLTVDMNMAEVKVSRGDYDQGEAGRLMERAGAHATIARAWVEGFATTEGVRIEPKGRRTLVFTPTVEVAHLMAEAFTAVGVAAAYVHGGTPMEERRQLLARFSSGELEVLANCAVLTEGYDNPRVDCVVVARPTRSRALYVQMIGRGTRRHPDKDDCLVLDVVGASAEHSLVTIPTLFGVEAKAREASQSVMGAISARDEEEVKAGRLRAEEADLFAKVAASKVKWLALHTDGEARRYICSLGNGHPTVVIAQVEAEREDGWVVGLRHPNNRKEVLMRDLTLEMAQGVGEDYARKHAPKPSTVAAQAGWRKGKPSPKAVDAANKWRLPNVDSYRTAGDLSDALTIHIERIKSKPKNRRKS